MKKKTSWEVRFWHGFGKVGYERWILPVEPQFLASGAVQFTDSDGHDVYIIGTIEITKRN